MNVPLSSGIISTRVSITLILADRDTHDMLGTTRLPPRCPGSRGQIESLAQTLDPGPWTLARDRENDPGTRDGVLGKGSEPLQWSGLVFRTTARFPGTAGLVSSGET